MQTVAITAATMAVISPVLKTARSAGFQLMATQSLNQLGKASHLYLMDNEDRFPPAMEARDHSIHAWFGEVDDSKHTDPKTGVFYPYLKGPTFRDPSANYKPYLGDGTGFGYNWCTLGSDACATGNYESFNHSQNPAELSQLSHPGETVMFASSVYVNAQWAKGDGQFYDYGFVSPPSLWKGVPDVDFRYRGATRVDLDNKTVESDGIALVLFTDGAIKPLKKGDLEDKLFLR
ncbi:MAG: hypothetical protein JSS72_07240 [Armatimonadetes bacterium]|nr:hypothetical protein [Armatimonadota bacterium]